MISNLLNLFGISVGTQAIASSVAPVAGAVIFEAAQNAADVFIPPPDGRTLLAASLLAATAGPRIGRRVLDELKRLQSSPDRYYYDQLEQYYEGTNVAIEPYRKEGKIFDPMEELKKQFGYAFLVVDLDRREIFLTEHPRFQKAVRRLVRHIQIINKDKPRAEAILAELTILLEKHGYYANGKPKPKPERPLFVPGEPVANREVKKPALDLKKLPPAPEGLKKFLEPYLDLRGVRKYLAEGDVATLDARMTTLQNNLPNGDEPGEKPEAGGSFVGAYDRYTRRSSADTAIPPEEQKRWLKDFAEAIGMSEAIERYDGHWIYGRLDIHAFRRIEESGRIGRFYLAVKPEEAAKVWNALKLFSAQLEREEIFFQFKMGLRREMYHRADVAVVYVDADHQQALYHVMNLLAYNLPFAFRDETPLFTAQVLSGSGKKLAGIAFGQNPAFSDESFGGLRAYALTEANREIRRRVEAGERLTVEDAFKLMAHYLDKAGIDINHPAFNKGGIPLFQPIFEKTDQDS